MYPDTVMVTVSPTVGSGGSTWIEDSQAKADEADDPFQKKFFILLSKEESEHFLSLLDTVEYLEDPQGYFSQLERGTMTF